MIRSAGTAERTVRKEIEPLGLWSATAAVGEVRSDEVAVRLNAAAPDVGV